MLSRGPGDTFDKLIIEILNCLGGDKRDHTKISKGGKARFGSGDKKDYWPISHKVEKQYGKI